MKAKAEKSTRQPWVRRRGAWLIGALVMLLASAMPASAQNTRAETSAAGQLRKERDEFIAKVQKDLSIARTKLDQVKREAYQASGKARSELDDDLHALEQQTQAVYDKVSHLKSVAVEKWTSFKGEVETDLKKLKESLHKLESSST